MITFTPNALERIGVLLKKQAEDGDCFRIGLQPGGCAGMSYVFAVDKKKDSDAVIQLNGYTVIMDVSSAKLIQGSTVDFIDSANGAAFKVENPQAQGGCGCGSSVQL